MGASCSTLSARRARHSKNLTEALQMDPLIGPVK
jgi:hypothetical protein